MRKIININENWKFTKKGEVSSVNLPHSWNAVDGQEGADYYRGRCSYERELPPLEEESYLEINGANSVCEVYLNGTKIAEHSGGYSAFRTHITPHLKKEKNVLRIDVDNRDNERVYPSSADFTFYGGLYRDVNIITGLKPTHFSTDIGRNGIFANPMINADGSATLVVKAHVVTQNDSVVKYILRNKEGNVIASAAAPANEENVSLGVSSPILWNGLKNPYLYTLECSLIYKEEEVDKVETRIGFRTIAFDNEKGCSLNGEYIKLKGVSRHQDRLGMGNAITLKEHREDIDLILEVGANSVRLAHYQQNQSFYDLCDEKGLLVWAEVPVISQFSKRKQENAKSQLRELITQNYNHPCIFCWGVQNEITLTGKRPGLEKGIRELNELARVLDPMRPTTSAQAMIGADKNPLNYITDILGYNLYYGWYSERYDAIGPWLDKFHTINPDVKLCLSEYGAEAILAYQTDKGIQGDYTESYQAILHNHYARAIAERQWLWGSYVWNMFDFGAANRNEAGVKGRNNKGLVSFDRKIKKDAFYVYKAYWSEEPFVHLMGSRYINRPIGTTSISVCSNQDKVTIYVNDKEYTADCDKMVCFNDIEVVAGENKVVAESGGLKDEFTVIGVASPDPSYKMPPSATSIIRNWFRQEGSNDSEYFSIYDKVGDLMASDEVKALIITFLGNKKKLFKLLNLLKPFRLVTLMKIIRLEPQMQDIASNYLQTIRKKQI